MTIDAKKLANLLREAVRLREDWRDALIEVAVQIEDGESAAGPAPVPADVREVVREALRVALAWPPPHSDSAELIRKALDALDAAPAETEPDDDPVYEWHPRSLYDALDGIAVYGGDTLSGPVKGAPTVAWLRSSVYEMVRRARYAMDHFGPDTSPPEKVVGYTVMRSGGYGPSPMVYDSAAAVRTVLRDTGYPDVPIVKLVEVPDQ